ncbi:MAG: alpha/beta fold hydrolase [Porticoccaceae bacterium]|nr:alpha/beta fold hydrolase [Pseudomonadales bacterium]MCP5171187.1 alpha/beta fold hydrolase [Pseudomonadales bacterium]MCP5301575.1 alpha/beta fold hydrolase [Pseudomonadales bacterium]
MPERKFEIDNEEYPFTSHWFERNGTPMHYLDEGEGVPVVFCHGNPTWSFLYRNIIKELSGECRCIAHDLPGFGFSEHPPGYGYTPQEHAEWLEDFLIGHLKLEKFILVVQDWGGPTGLTVATKYPDRVLGVVISSTWAWKASGTGYVFSKLMGNPLARQLILKKNFFAKTLVPKLLGEGSNNSAIRQAYTAPFPTPDSRMGTAEFPKQITAAAPWLEELESRLHKLKDKPVEFVFGLKDLMSKPADIDKWLSHFPDANVQKIPDANHYTQEDCPENYVIAVRSILKKVAE